MKLVLERPASLPAACCKYVLDRHAPVLAVPEFGQKFFDELVNKFR